MAVSLLKIIAQTFELLHMSCFLYLNEPNTLKEHTSIETKNNLSDDLM